LENIYVKPVNEVYARHKLNTCRQKGEEKIEEFFQRLKILSADCNFAVTAAQNRGAAIRDACVAGLRSGYIQQRLLEDNVSELQAAFDKARTLSVCRWKESAVSAAASDILASNALRETAFATNARRKDIFPVFVCLSLKTRRQQLL